MRLAHVTVATCVICLSEKYSGSSDAHEADCEPVVVG
jgi:hypothetical protein